GRDQQRLAGVHRRLVGRRRHRDACGKRGRDQRGQDDTENAHAQGAPKALSAPSCFRALSTIWVTTVSTACCAGTGCSPSGPPWLPMVVCRACWTVVCVVTPSRV